MNKRILSMLLFAIFFSLVPYQVMAESSPYGYLPKEEIEAIENGTQLSTTISGINYEYNKILNSISETYHYTVYDINKDNCPELIIQTGISEADKHNYIYAYENEQTIKIYDEDGIHTRFAPYTVGNGIIIEWSSMAGCSINKVTYDIGSTTSQIIDELSYEDSLDDKKVDVFWDSVDKYTAGTLLTLYPASDRTHIPKSVEVNGVFDDISKEINQIREFIGRGLYLEAIRDCDQTISWHKISDADISVLESLKEEANWRYESFVESLQYDNVSAEVNQIKNYISKGLYLEAMRDCFNTKSWHNLSFDDIYIIDSLYNEASKKYNLYLEKMADKPISNEQKAKMFNIMKTYIDPLLKSSHTAIWPNSYKSDDVSYVRVFGGVIFATLRLEATNSFGAYGKVLGQFKFDDNLNVLWYFVE